ncbi:hypothetical protein JCM5296_000925 [Sporobolomyces johnsonii]
MLRRALTLGDSAKEKSTTYGYTRQLAAHWFPFLRIYNLPDKPTLLTVLAFIAFAAARVIHVDKILSAVRWWYRLGDADWLVIRKHPLVVAALEGHAKRSAFGQPRRRSPPLLSQHLLAFLQHALRPGASHDDFLAATIAVVGFGGLMRLGELVMPARIAERDPRKYVRRDTVLVDGRQSFAFFLPYHKADRLWHGSHVTIVAENSIPGINFVDVFRAYLRRRDALKIDSPYLFLRRSGEVPSRSFFTSRLRLFAPSVTGHGLRSGGATFLASRGVRPDIIQRIGRWSSSAWTIYIRDNPAVAAVVQRVELQ